MPQEERAQGVVWGLWDFTWSFLEALLSGGHGGSKQSLCSGVVKIHNIDQEHKGSD